MKKNNELRERLRKDLERLNYTKNEINSILFTKKEWKKLKRKIKKLENIVLRLLRIDETKLSFQIQVRIVELSSKLLGLEYNKFTKLSHS